MGFKPEPSGLLGKQIPVHALLLRYYAAGNTPAGLRPYGAISIDAENKDGLPLSFSGTAAEQSRSDNGAR